MMKIVARLHMYLLEMRNLVGQGIDGAARYEGVRDEIRAIVTNRTARKSGPTLMGVGNLHEGNTTRSMSELWANPVALARREANRPFCEGVRGERWQEGQQEGFQGQGRFSVEPREEQLMYGRSLVCRAF